MLKEGYLQRKMGRKVSECSSNRVCETECEYSSKNCCTSMTWILSLET